MGARAVCSILIALCWLVPALAGAHPDDAWIAQRLALTEWAQAVTTGDREQIARLTVGGVARAGGSDVSHVITRYATFTPTEAGVTAGPVVIYVDGGAIQLAWSVDLVEEDGVWKIAGQRPAPDFPAELLPSGLPEHVATTPVEFSLLDADSGQAVWARVHITDAAGEYWPPRGHQKNIRTGWRQDVGGDVRIAGKTWAYVHPHFIADLPAGTLRLEVAKGTEYRPVARSFTVRKDGSKGVDVKIARWTDMNARGWYAGDTHTHFLDDHSALLELRAEDLNVVNVLATKWGELITDTERVTGAPSALSDPTGIVYFNEETRHGWLGHTILHPIGEPVYPLTWGGPSEGVPGGFDYPPMAHQADRAHAQGGIVTWAHFPFPGGELAVDIGLQKIDTVDLFTWGDTFIPELPLPTGETAPGTLPLYYAFLNTGSRLAATAGTDKMLNVQVTGSVKTYAYTGETFSYEAWIDALETGRTFVSTGPVLRFTANGQPIGGDLELTAGSDVVLEAHVHAPYDLYPIDRLEIVMGGEVVAATPNESGASELSVSATVTPDTSTWAAARANGDDLLPLQVWPLLGPVGMGVPPMAHTSPIYLTVDDARVWSAEAAAVLEASVDMAIAWARDTARYQTEEQRAEVIALYERAKQVYATGRRN